MKQYLLVPWEQCNEGLFASGEPAIIILPYEPITDQMREDVEWLRPCAVIPPYKLDEWNFNVRSAVTIRGHFPNQRVMVALPSHNHMEVRRYMSSLQADGFDAFAIPHEMGGTPVGHMAGFWEMSQILREPVWYHIAGGSAGPIASVKGYWSYSEEGL